MSGAGEPAYRKRLIRPAEERKVHTVSDANRIIKSLIERSLARLWVEGECSTVRKPSSGHIYFTLKDPQSQLKAVMYRDAVDRLPFRLDDGLAVVCFGKLTVFDPRGEYQLVVEGIEPRGVGAAQLALRQLKEKLEREGLFDRRRKRALPRFPRAIAIVTSATGAAVKDMLEVIGRRFPAVRVLLRPVRVQGERAAEEVAQALIEVARYRRADVVLVGRGGGSQEDLAAFNDERVARAIAAAPMPVVSCVGHAIDWTIADLVADVRAQTPTEAAELVTPVQAEVLAQLGDYRARLGQGLLRSVAATRGRLDLLARSYAFREPKERVRRLAQRLDELSERMPQAVARVYQRARERADLMASRLEALSPLRVLARGYSITFREGSSSPLLDAGSLAPGDLLRTRLGHGEVLSRVVPPADASPGGPG